MENEGSEDVYVFYYQLLICSCYKVRLDNLPMVYSQDWNTVALSRSVGGLCAHTTRQEK